MIIVLGHATVRPEHAEQALALSREHVRRSLAEPGCIHHSVLADPADACRLVFVEKWADQPALLEHVRLPASRAFGKALGEMAAEPPGMEVFEARAVPLR